jgi:hypothetical protein
VVVAVMMEMRSLLVKSQKDPLFWGGIPANQNTFLRKQERSDFEEIST